MSEDDKLCPFCHEPMIESAVTAAPNEPPRQVDPQAIGDEPPVVAKELSCPKCQHAEGTLNKGRGLG